MELALQLKPDNSFKQEETIPEFESFKVQPSLTQAKKIEKLLAMLPAIEKKSY